MFADVLDRGYEIYHGKNDRPALEPVVVTGAALGLPGTGHIFDDANIGRILRGEQFIDSIPTRFRSAMLDKHITRLVKSENGEARFEAIDSVADVIKLAGRGGTFDLENEFGISAERVGALDRVTQLAMAAGIDALRDAGIPLVMRYKTTSKGTQLPERWGLPEALRDETGVIFASAFPGLDSFADEMTRYHADHERREQLSTLESLLARAVEGDGDSIVVLEIKRRIEELRSAIAQEPYIFNRRFLLRTLSMGHSQFAEFIGARGPNTQLNSACATTTQAMSLAEDWIRAGRCRRVIIISADDVTSDCLMDWMGAGFLASGAAATDDVVADAAIPFDRRRHGMIIGMGAAALVVESAQAARERAIRPICEVLATITGNSAFHGTRLDVEHIGQVMENLVAKAETGAGISRRQIAPQTVFVSHETYTPARGGSASAEIHALRRVFGDAADRIVIANTKGFTGHAMATGIEDVVAVKALETGCVPPVANFKEVDPELGRLNLSKGGVYPVEYAIHLGAGFGSQISMMLLRWMKTKDGTHPSANALGYRYRVADDSAWSTWLTSIAGHAAGDLEVVQRTLRVRDHASAARVAAPSRTARLAAVATTVRQGPPVPIDNTQPARLPLRAVAETASAIQINAPAISPGPSSSSTPARAAATTSGSKVGPTFEPTVEPPVERAAAQTVAAKADPVKERVLALVAGKTGYPVDMLDLDLDLEADLGVDTVKQAEVFAAIREAYDIAREDNLKLRDYPTLAHVNGSCMRSVRAWPQHFVQLRKKSKAAAPVTVLGVHGKTAPSRGYRGDGCRRCRQGTHSGAGGREDRLSQRHARAGPRPRSRPGGRYRQAGRDVRDHPRRMTSRARKTSSCAIIPTFATRESVRVREAARPGRRRRPPGRPMRKCPPRSRPASPARPGTDDCRSRTREVLDIVAEKTGYPRDMLDLDLDLEADLGIDTVKQAEMFAAVRCGVQHPAR